MTCASSFALLHPVKSQIQFLKYCSPVLNGLLVPISKSLTCTSWRLKKSPVLATASYHHQQNCHTFLPKCFALLPSYPGGQNKSYFSLNSAMTADQPSLSLACCLLLEAQWSAPAQQLTMPQVSFPIFWRRQQPKPHGLWLFCTVHSRPEQQPPCRSCSGSAYASNPWCTWTLLKITISWHFRYANSRCSSSKRLENADLWELEPFAPDPLNSIRVTNHNTSLRSSLINQSPP